MNDEQTLQLIERFLEKVGSATEGEIVAYVQLHQEIEVNKAFIALAENRELTLSLNDAGEVCAKKREPESCIHS